MLCSQIQLRKQEIDYETVRLLPCRSWGCEYCAPRRRRQLMAKAASGKPRICLTLTVSEKAAPTVVERYQALHRAWKVLVKRIVRQFAREPRERWLLTTEDGYQYQEIQSFRIHAGIRAKRIKRVHYMAFAEETENGEPHLHILLRTLYIPQRWISQQMQDLVQSPIVWIEKVKGASRAIAYVAKYVTEAPAQFGKSQRYWTSKYYQLKSQYRAETPIMNRQNSALVRQRFGDLIKTLMHTNRIAMPISPVELQLWQTDTAIARFGEEGSASKPSRLVEAYIWLRAWHQRIYTQ